MLQRSAMGTGAVPGCAPPHLDAQVEELWAGVALVFYMGEEGSKFRWGGLHGRS
jgi:hypothetical protein